MWWYIAGFFSFPIALIIGVLLVEAIRTAFDWLYTKQQEIKANGTNESQIICRLRDYIEYVDDKIAKDEMPLNYMAWQQANGFDK